MEPGLLVSYYEGRWSKVPDFSSMTPIRQRIAAAIDVSCRQRPEYYAPRYLGFIRIPRDGTYTFILSSDDGSWLRLGGAMSVNHDGPHGTSDKSGRVFRRSGIYPLELSYFQASGGQALGLWIEGPATPEHIVPPGMLFHGKGAKCPLVLFGFL